MGLDCFDSVHATRPMIKKSRVGILAFQIAGIMSKLKYMWQLLSDKNMVRLLNEPLCLQGVFKFVSTDSAFLLALASAEMVENLKIVSNLVSALRKRCQDSNLRKFEMVFDEFANTGSDPHGWVFSWEVMEAKITKIGRLVAATTELRYKNSLKRHEHKKVYILKQQKVIDLLQKLQWQKLKINFFKKKSLWNRSFDTITSLLARTIFTVLSRIKLFCNINHVYDHPPSLPRGLSPSATAYPSDQSGPLFKSSKHQENTHLSHGFFETNSNILKPSSTTLGAAGLALHYAKLIIITEKSIKSPQLVGDDARARALARARAQARDIIYSMLPNSIRASLRRRLKGLVFTASDLEYSSKLKETLGKILGRLSPLAYNTVEWQSKRSLKHQNLNPKTGVLLLQTLFFADQQKTEAAITELLVGLNYIWRFEREMNAKALLNCTNFKNNIMQQQHIS